MELGGVIIQNGKTVAFYTWNLNPAQIIYINTERELEIVVESLK